MSQLNAGTRRLKHSEDWTQAEGVLPVERALADEHEALHGKSITAALEAITVDFDATQFVDVPALARDFRDALGPRDSGIPVAENPQSKSEPELTPRDAWESPVAGPGAATSARRVRRCRCDGQCARATLAAALRRLQWLLTGRLMDTPAFRSFRRSGCG